MIYNPRPYEPCNAAPTATEIQRLRLEAHINLQQINCYQPGTEHSGWLWILLDPAEWQELQMVQNNIASDDAAAIAALEPFPTCTRPTIFTILDAWTDKIITEHKEAHAQNSYHFQYKTNLERDILLDLCKAISSELITDLQDEAVTLSTPAASIFCITWKPPITISTHVTLKRWWQTSELPATKPAPYRLTTSANKHTRPF